MNHKLSYTDVHNKYRDIIRDMSLSSYKPDVVVALLRGGADMGVKLSHYFSVPVHFVEWQTRDGSRQERDKLLSIVHDYSEGQQILVVDDICDSGKTLEQVLNTIDSAEVSTDVSFAVLVENMDSDFECNWSGFPYFKNQEPIWWVFPWEEFWNDDAG